MRKTRKQRHRSKTAISKTVKKMMSLLQAEHLDFFSKVHKHDVANNREFLGEVLGNADVVKLSDEQVKEVLKLCGFELKEQSTFVEYADIMKTFEFAENLCFENGMWTAKRGDDWLNFVTGIIEDESIYYERGHAGNAKKRERGAKGLTGDKFTEPLNVIFARTPPWLASVLSEATDEQMVKKALLNVATEFEKKTGYKVHAMNIHREAGHDLHIHIMYSDVRAQRITVGVKNRMRQVAALKKKLTAEMSEQKKTDPSISLEKSAIKAEYDKRGLDSLVVEYTGEVEYRKVLRRGSKDNGKWPIEKRSVATMGTAYRYKGWIWDSASNPDDKKAIAEFRNNSLINANFINKVAKIPDLEGRYLDWWLEKEMFRSLYDGLSEDRKKLVDAGKDAAVKSYLEYGKTVVHPMQQATLRHKVKIDHDAGKDRDKLAVWKAEAQGALDKYESELDKRDADLEVSEIDNELDAAMNVVHEVSVEWDREEVSKSFNKLEDDKKRVASVEQKAQVVLGRESQLEDRSKELDARSSKLDVQSKDLNSRSAKLDSRETELGKRDVSLTKREESIREEGRLEILSEVSKRISPTTSVKSKNEVLDKVSEISDMAKVWDKVKSKVEKLINTVESLKKPAKWLSGMVADLKSAMGISDKKKKDKGDDFTPGE